MLNVQKLYYFFLFVLSLLILVLIHFNIFFSKVKNSNIENHIKTKIDSVVVLTGDKFRIVKGLELLSQNPDSKLLLSGVNKDIPLVEEKPKTQKADVSETVNQAAYVVSSLTGNIVPAKDKVFVPWGHFKDIKSIVSSKQFYPIFITGLSGNGKTMNVSQACAQTKRECIRVNITIETDEDDLLGGYRLQDGQTVY